MGGPIQRYRSVCTPFSLRRTHRLVKYSVLSRLEAQRDEIRLAIAGPLFHIAPSILAFWPSHLLLHSAREETQMTLKEWEKRNEMTL